ncbi:hypothetical protein Tco_0226127 [Tanacetum coccineum]
MGKATINVSESAQDRDVGLGEADSETSTSKDNEDPSWNTLSRPGELKRQFKALEALGRTLFNLYLTITEDITCTGAGAVGYGRAQNRVGNANAGQARQIPVYDKAGPSYDSDVLSEVQDHDHYQDAVCDHHEKHEMHNDVQPNHVVDSHADYTSDSNMTSKQYKAPNLCTDRSYDDCEETLELSEISRKKMHDKMKAKACVDNKVNFTPPNYSKENFLATFSPQKQLTPEQLFWSQDIVKMKAEALKEHNTRPIKALLCNLPPNTPTTLCP